MSRRRVTIAGAGELGAACASLLARRDDLDVVLVDAHAATARGRALDLNHAAALGGFEPRVAGTDSFAEAAGSDLCVIALEPVSRSQDAAARRLEAAANQVAEAAAGICEHSPDSVVVVATEPLHAMCHTALDATGFPRQRVVGTGGVLDTARLRTLIAWELGVSVRDVTCLVLGGRGEAMVPLLSRASVAGAPLERVAGTERLNAIAGALREGGGEVERLLGAPAGHAAAAAVAAIVDSIAGDRGRVMPCAALCQGEYGVRDVYVGVPCTLGASGIERIVEIELDADELDALRSAAEVVSEQVAGLAG